MSGSTLELRPRAHDFLHELQREESSQRTQFCNPGDLALREDGAVLVGGQAHACAADAQKDLAALASIPLPYFADLDGELRALNFNRRLRAKTDPDDRLAIVWNDKTITQVRRQQLGRLPLYRTVETVLEQAPADTIPNDIRVIVYARGAYTDLSLVSRSQAWSTTPRPGDIVHGGVSLTVEESGAIQVGPVTFRLVCSNGAMARVCADGRHRLRRGNGPDSERKLLSSLREFARAAWQDWERVQQGLRELVEKRIAPDALAHLVQRLRQSPFFISAGAARRVLAALRDQQTDDLTLYDLFNAVSFVGSHDNAVLPRYRYRLRLGAGQLARGRAQVCQACRQLVLA